ncbi:hypothetical protein HFO50_11250 [Rhizobium leguminosarum]|uniref:hypothetical protein n=1 Tax=Rhizobium leguminosarum TaxID=384 RepID=UPI001C9487BF|nr:hypothetical protein [Rhizobium leguminosarum]MBY5601746.1 hypothetical protein [Rhizobium leguminosarum]
MTPVVTFPETYWNQRKLSRRERTALRDTAAYILQPEHGRGRAVCACGHLGKGSETVALILRKDGTAGTLGTLRCGSPWLCADCAPLKAQQRLERLQTLADALVASNGKMVSITITVSHGRESSLMNVKNAIETASRNARQGEPWNRQKKLHQVIGVLSAPEVTYSHTNGWHFHIHHAFLTENSGNPEALGSWFVQRYLRYLEKSGFTADIRSQEVSLIRDPRNYIRYLRKGVGRITNDVWNPQKDVTRQRKHLYPFDILQRASGSEVMKKLWREYATVMPGTRSCVITRSIAVRLNIRHDDDCVKVDHGCTAGYLPASIWAALVNRKKTNVILSLLEDQGVEAWQQINSLAHAFGAAKLVLSVELEDEQRQEQIPTSRFEHRPSAAQIAGLALHLKWHLSGKERNGEAIRVALDRERGHAVANGLAFFPPKIRDVLEIYGNDGVYPSASLPA